MCWRSYHLRVLAKSSRGRSSPLSADLGVGRGFAELSLSSSPPVSLSGAELSLSSLGVVSLNVFRWTWFRMFSSVSSSNLMALVRRPASKGAVAWALTTEEGSVYFLRLVMSLCQYLEFCTISWKESIERVWSWTISNPERQL